MKKFYERNNELEILENAYRNKANLIILNGPRNVGKTELAKQFIQDKPHLYFSAGDFNDELNRKNFLENLKLNYGLQVKTPKDVPNWEELVSLYIRKPEEEDKVLVIDNFDLLLQNKPDSLKEFVKIWNTILKPNNITTIFIFPNNSILFRLLKQSNPLIKNSDLRIQLNPFNFLEFQKNYPDNNLSDLISLYNIAGGVPLYWTLLEDKNTIKSQIKTIVDLMFDPSSILYELPLKLLEKDISRVSDYTTILYYLAQGVQTVADLVSKTKYRKSEVEQYLENLERLGYVGRKISINKRRASTKNFRYYIKSPLFNFWFRYIYPNSSTLNKERIIKMIQNDYPNYIEDLYSRLIGEFLLLNIEKGIFDFEPSRIGSFWNKDSEIQLVAIDDKNRRILLADSQFSLKDYDLDQFKDFIISTQDIKELRKYRNYEKIYALFSANTPSEEMIKYAMNNEDILLFTGKTLINMK